MKHYKPKGGKETKYHINSYKELQTEMRLEEQNIS